MEDDESHREKPSEPHLSIWIDVEGAVVHVQQQTMMRLAAGTQQQSKGGVLGPVLSQHHRT
jgi:hypothetical protein